jgi:hypothetical protein
MFLPDTERGWPCPLILSKDDPLSWYDPCGSAGEFDKLRRMRERHAGARFSGSLFRSRLAAIGQIQSRRVVPFNDRGGWLAVGPLSSGGRSEVDVSGSIADNLIRQKQVTDTAILKDIARILSKCAGGRTCGR